jgi:aryl-alcohol dehydrogenase-like predicted oxidoreductase
MEYRPLGRTGITVSSVCLGTMTWGSQNSEAEAHAQIDHALERGITFVDTAEGYPVTPSSPETRGRTEDYIGSWIAANRGRDRFVLATKAAGPARGSGMDADKRLDRAGLEAALDGSLRRLRTDHIDLYQLHWPDRRVPRFGERGLQRLADDAETVPIEETLSALGDLVKAGKIRAFGVSNETPWGVSEFLRLSREKDLPRVASIQNAYSLLNRVFEVGLSEFSLREDVGLLAYSPLAAGHLSGKYLGGRIPPGSRLDVAKQFTRYNAPQQPDASARYLALARAFGLDPVELALGFVHGRSFVTSSIIGATSVEQLDADISASLVALPADVLEAIEKVQRVYPDPCP